MCQVPNAGSSHQQDRIAGARSRPKGAMGTVAGAEVQAEEEGRWMKWDKGRL